YDLNRFMETGEPNVVYTLARETHASDENGHLSELQHSFVYSDGFGREVQTKVQAEPGEVNGEYVEKRWVGTGTNIYNNKGKPVQQYEPFFSDAHEFNIEKHGVSPTLFYDPPGRVVCTIHPDHTYEKVVFNPWKQETWDVNDTVRSDPRTDEHIRDYVAEYFSVYPDWQTWLEERIPGFNPDLLPTGLTPEQKAAIKAAAHADTSTEAHLDTLGRPFLTKANNGKDSEGKDILLETRVKLDIESNDLKITDPRGIDAFVHAFDIAGQKLRIDSVDAGLQLAFQDVAGNPLYVWDANGDTVQTKYDELRRPTELWVRYKDNPDYFLSQKTIYGEDKSDSQSTNHRMQVWKIYDGAGLVISEEYDFKGNLKQQSRRLLADGKSQVQWPVADGLFDEAGVERLLESLDRQYVVQTDYDALNRIIFSKTPDGTVQSPIYNEANLLNSLNVIRPDGTEKIFVKNIDYNEKGQRTKIEYGNDVITEYSYDPLTYRLTDLLTTRRKNPKKIQELKYTYDPAGNITSIRDDAHARIFNHNDIIDPESVYTYDPLYRLIKASGREHEAMTACHHHKRDKKHTEFIQLTGQPVNNGQALCNYTEKYAYDKSGNITLIDHFNTTKNSHWKRVQKYEQTSNRILKSNAGCPAESNALPHDANGNITRLLHLPSMVWDYSNQLIEVQLNEGGNHNKAYYQYDAGGQRIRKTIVKNGKTEERIYLGGYEIYTEQNSSGATYRRDTIHVMDDKDRIALIEEEIDLETGDVQNSRIRYQLNNHLGSSVMEIDDTPDANFVSYEEYYPYGGTAYLAGENWSEVKKKRYRYSGKERDDETGLYYYGARYYAPWMGRWLSCDPIGLDGGVNLFLFVLDNPICHLDEKGRTPSSWVEKLHESEQERVQLEWYKQDREKYRALYVAHRPGKELNRQQLDIMHNLQFRLWRFEKMHPYFNEGFDNGELVSKTSHSESFLTFAVKKMGNTIEQLEGYYDSIMKVAYFWNGGKYEHKPGFRETCFQVAWPSGSPFHRSILHTTFENISEAAQYFGVHRRLRFGLHYSFGFIGVKKMALQGGSVIRQEAATQGWIRVISRIDEHLISQEHVQSLGIDICPGNLCFGAMSGFSTDSLYASFYRGNFTPFIDDVYERRQLRMTLDLGPIKWNALRYSLNTGKNKPNLELSIVQNMIAGAEY
ncbi:MAG: RHS repeat-associated core domain-containing protein, partial [Bacteroidales bacterium]|nr:RHS repeat-associated core domain-containing protein [Bacteroidales bacterium]